MWSISGYIIFYALGFRVEIIGEQAPRNVAPVLVVAPHTSFLDVFTIALCYSSPVARIENSDTPVLWAPQAIGHTIFVDRFQTGGFKPGVPVQPVTIRYSRPDLTTWTR